MSNTTQPPTAAPIADGSDAIPPMDRHVLERTAAHLHERYAHVVDRETVDQVLQDSYLELERQAAVKSHLAPLAGKFADSKLRAIGITRGIIEAPLPRVLFIDDANAGRSQMAASMLLKFSEGRVMARSAGIRPAGHLYEEAVAVMAEMDIPLDQAYPKPLAADVHEAAQHVITMACADRVEQLADKNYRDWEIPNFQGRSLEDIRAMRDDLEQRVRNLIREIDQGVGEQPPVRMSA